MKSTFTKVYFKQCAASDKKMFPQSKCIMPISIGVKIHEGEKFLATMQLINASFQSCALLMDDSIQRYTMKIDEPYLTLDDLYIKAIQKGDEWLERNKQAYENLTIPYDIIRWEDWRTHKDFDKSYSNIEALYNADEQYKHAIHATIEDFLSRYVIRMVKSNFDRMHAFDCCLQYLKEECAVMCLWAQEKFAFEVYPSGRSKAMRATYEKLIQPVYPNLLKSISLYFEEYIKKDERLKCLQPG